MRLAVSVELFKTPIIIMTPGESISLLFDLTLTLETLLRQPGIEPKNVVIFYNSTCCESVKHLVNLFGFISAEYPSDEFTLQESTYTESSETSSLNHRQQFNSTGKSDRVNTIYYRSKNRHRKVDKLSSPSHHTTYNTLYNKMIRLNNSSTFTDDSTSATFPVNLFKHCLQTVHLLFPEAQQFILIESHLILSPDFLSYFGQMLPLLTSHSMTGDSVETSGNKIVAISAWNENGFTSSSSDSSVAYIAKVDNYKPRLAMMIPRIKHFDSISFPESLTWSFDESIDIQKSLPRECSRTKFIYNHTVDCNAVNSGYIVFPDVSRVSLIAPTFARTIKQRHRNEISRSMRRIKSFTRHFMTSARKINLNEDIKISNMDIFHSIDTYELMVRTLIDQSSASFKNNIQSAIDWIENVEKNSNNKCKSGKNVCIVTVFESNTLSYQHFCKYFNLVNCKEQITLKSIGSVVRFTVPYNIHVILIDETTVQV